MQEWILGVMNSYGYWAILFLIALENVFPPIPSEVILTFGGFMTTYTTMNIWGVVIMATIGSLVGAVILYLVGRCLSPERLECWVNGRLGRILRLKSSDIKRAEGWFEKRGKATVFFCRFVPVIRSLISIPAGMARMKMPIFLFLTAVGSFIWNIVLVLLGAAAGASWEKIVGYMNVYSKVGVVILGVAAVIAVVVFYKKQQKKKEDAGKEGK